MRLPWDAGEPEALAACVPDAVIESSAVVRRAIVAAEPGYRDAQALLDRPRRDEEIAALRAETAALHRAGQWQAVIAVGERLQALTHDILDPDGLTTSARAELRAGQARLLAEAHQRPLRHLMRVNGRPPCVNSPPSKTPTPVTKTARSSPPGHAANSPAARR